MNIGRFVALPLAAVVSLQPLVSLAQPALHIEMSMRGTLVADGKSHRTIVVRVLDVEGHPVQTHPVIALTVASGDALLSDGTVKPAERITIKPDKAGEAHVELYSGVRSGEIEVVAVPDSVDAQDISHALFREVPLTRAPFVVGLMSVGAGSMPATVDGNDTFDNGNSRRGRLAAYATGHVGGSVNGTFAYESANRLSPSYAFGALGQDPRSQSYLTYGDTSTRTEDALSRQRFYAKLDDGRNSLTYGEFDTASPSAAASRFQMHALLNGVRLHVAGPSGRSDATLFTAKNDLGYGRLVLPALGLGAANLMPNLVVGSESVVLVSLDRHTGAPLSQTPLTRGVDYTIDYFSGAIRFITIPLPYDGNFNPREVVITYQYDRVGAASTTTGGTGDFLLADGKTHARLGYTNIAYAGGKYALVSQELNGKLHGGTWELSHGYSLNEFGIEPYAGDLYHAAFSTSSGENRFFGAYDQTDASYSNPFGGLSTPGLSTLRAGYERKLARGGALTLEYDAARQLTSQGFPPTSQYDDSLGVHLRDVTSDRLTLHAGLDARTGNMMANNANPFPLAPQPAGARLLGTLGFDWRISKRLTLAVQRVATLSGTQDPSAPSETDAQVGYLLPKGRVYVAQRWAGSIQQPVAGNAIGSLSAMARSSTIFGFDQSLSAATSLTSGYVVERTLNGTDAYALMGVKERFELGKVVHGDAFLQQGSGLDHITTYNGGNHFAVYGLNLAYAKKHHLRATASFQNRTGFGGGATLEAGFAGPISSEITAVGSLSNSDLGGYLTDDTRFGFAWRPSGNNRGSALLGYERYSSNYQVLANQTDVLSYDQLYRPSRSVELAAHVAYKLNGDAYYAAHTALFGFRASQRISRRVDVAAEWSALSQASIAGDAQSSFAAELGYRVGPSARLGLGYSFEGAADPSLIGRPNHRGIYATFTTVIDRFFGWGRETRR